MTSIKQNHHLRTLPDFRNLGIQLRVLLLANLFLLCAAVIRSSNFSGISRELVEMSALAQPVIILSLLVLAVIYPWIRKLNYYASVALILCLELVLVSLVYLFGYMIFGMDLRMLERYWLLTLIATAALLIYFDLRNRALSPALSEARLQALQARIRPHFLFNSINAVLSLIRADPKRAEVALGDMAALFRVLMADNSQLSTLQREVDLCRQYLDLEQLRLGERLNVEWHIENMPHDALIPPLLLQPLLENAVYHGIEPMISPGIISINIYLRRGQVHAVLRNPYLPPGGHHEGNKMALANISERLSLHFDAEASIHTNASGNVFQVHIIIPYRTQK